jgi:hypothetical protein
MTQLHDICDNGGGGGGGGGGGLFMQLRTAVLLRLIVRSWLEVPTFATRLLHSCHHARAASGGRWNCGREMSGTA